MLEHRIPKKSQAFPVTRTPSLRVHVTAARAMPAFPHDVAFDAVEAPEKIEVPPGTARIPRR